VPRAAGGREPPVLKRFGQHFLTDPKILNAIVDALAPTKSDTVLEIGPGRGALTDILAGRAGKVIGVEIDRMLAAQLREKYATAGNVEIVEGDFLGSSARDIAGEDFLLIGNVPYYITTPIVFKALEPPMPRRSVFLVQREVAQRMAAKAGEDDYGALSVNVAVVANVEQVLLVPAGAFKPPPKVESAVVRLTPREQPLVALSALPAFRTFVQAAFGQRRKQMHRVLRSIRGISAEEASQVLGAVGIEASDRPEVVSPAGFVGLFDRLSG
jgi:16S rRNA (adenine1518-N6/adenine1519-N6)-dimethyltransferase